MSSKLATAEPTTFGSYELIEKVATGGMAEVYRARARRPGGVSKIVCLKRIHPTLCADPSFVDMFIEEARLGLTLSHGNIVPVFDFGCIDGYHFLVMDFVEGHDLSEIIARARIVGLPFPEELAVFAVLEILEGLAYAHERKDEQERPLELVHRDISPSNVMVSRSGEVKILDFGIARSALREFRTRTGVVKGKPGYMAPEQARGDLVDPRVDIYACGVMLYELLTGERPNRSSEDEEDTSIELEETVDTIDNDDIAAIVEKALEEDKAFRFVSAADMRDALTDHLRSSGSHPQASSLSRYVRSLFESAAAEPDWTHQDDAVDRHLAALVDGRDEPLTDEMDAEPTDSGRRTEELISSPPAVESDEPRTETLDGGEGKRKSRRGVALLFGAILLLAAAAGVGFLAGPSELQEAPQPVQTEAPAEPAPTASATPARVDLRTTPEGASLRVDGAIRDMTTPAIVELDEGTHTLLLEREGYRPLEREVVVRGGQAVLLELVMIPRPGTIHVESTPTGAAVSLNGVSRGTTPIDIEDLERTVTYHLEVTRPGFEPWSTDFSLREQRERTLMAELVRPDRDRVVSSRTGFLSVVAHPWAEVMLDGRTLGETPIIRRTVRAGRHTLVLRNSPRGAEVRRSVNVPVGDEVRVSVDLTRED